MSPAAIVLRRSKNYFSQVCSPRDRVERTNKLAPSLPISIGSGENDRFLFSEEEALREGWEKMAIKREIAEFLWNN